MASAGSAAPTAPALRAGSGVAYFAVDAPRFIMGRRSGTESLLRVGGGRVERVELTPCDGPIRDLAVSEDGRAYVTCSANQIYEVTDRTPRAITIEGCSVPRFFGGADRSLWALCDDAFHGHDEALLLHHDGQQFVRETARELRAMLARGGLRRAWRSVAVDTRGRPYVAAPNLLLARDAGGWQQIPIEPPAQYPELLATSDGKVWLEASWTLREVANGALGEPLDLHHLAPRGRAHGGLALLDDFAGSVRFVDAAFANERSLDLLAGSLFVNRTPMTVHEAIEDFAVDARDRVWLATAVGVFVGMPNGTVEHWEPGRVAGLPLLPVHKIALSGDGPELPELAPKVRGTLTGRVPAGRPVPVALCMGETDEGDDLVVTGAGELPCPKSPERIVTKSDASGAFRIDEVPPLPAVMLFVERGDARGRWWARHTACCSDLRPGEVRELELHPPGVIAL
ncbi:MAG: hypothetical protein IT373_01700 [Polyangiaceae bacterium]|nr:hypothetical protein [Polyangiaceae bacterium]